MAAHPARELTDQQRTKIVTLLKAGDVTQKDVASRFGVNKSTIGRIWAAHLAGKPLNSR
jgi:transcriptional regulator with XRE-family HTH domain